jgi:hypothetical protein
MSGKFVPGTSPARVPLTAPSSLRLGLGVGGVALDRLDAVQRASGYSSKDRA